MQNLLEDLENKLKRKINSIKILTIAINDFAKKRNLHSDISLTGDDIREGMTGVVSVRVKEPQFEGQTKTKLGNTDMKSKVQILINEEFLFWMF